MEEGEGLVSKLIISASPAAHFCKSSCCPSSTMASLRKALRDLQAQARKRSKYYYEVY